MSDDGVHRFFAYARERHTITLRRAAGEPREKWTKDPILQKYRFTCIFRELDKTTTWFRKHVRDPMRDGPDVLLATVVFRMLNRISTGEAMFCQPDLEGRTAFDKFLETGKSSHLKRDVLSLLPRGPYVTGAYIISSPPGLSKLDGMMKILEEFHRNSEWRNLADDMLRRETSYQLEAAHWWFKRQPWLGSFHSYEIVTDLRWTRLLERAPDIDTWASVGPGARRGLNRVFSRDKRDKSLGADEMLAEMRYLLACSRDEEHWPQKWQRWELREVEMTTCEIDKYERVRLGEGRPRGVYR